MTENFGNSKTRLFAITVCLYGAGHLWIGVVGINHHLGAWWASIALVAFIFFRFSLPITVGAFFGAMNVWGWHGLPALLFAAPGLGFLAVSASGSLWDIVRKAAGGPVASSTTPMLIRPKIVYPSGKAKYASPAETESFEIASMPTNQNPTLSESLPVKATPKTFRLPNIRTVAQSHFVKVAMVFLAVFFWPMLIPSGCYSCVRFPWLSQGSLTSPIKLPSRELSKIAGSGYPLLSSFRVEAYNGSEWTVTRVDVELKKMAIGQPVESRRYQLTPTLGAIAKPFSEASFRGGTGTFLLGVNIWEWEFRLVEAYGFKE